MRTDFIMVGATLDPHAAFLIQRGLKTYVLRYERQCANALSIARLLEMRPEVARVHYPGLDSHPRHALAMRQMSDAGAIVTIDLQPDMNPARFAEALRLFTMSASVGSTESLVQPGRLMLPGDLKGEAREAAGITEHTMRLSVGVEDVGDLIADLDQALQQARTGD